MDTIDEAKKPALMAIYDTEEDAQYAYHDIENLNKALELREQNSIVFNGVSYSANYEYNRRKAINYAPARNPKDDRQVTFGIIHEKIVSFVSIFLKYVFKRNVKCFDSEGRLVDGMGKIYDLAIEHSYRLESFKKLIALIYWELYSQGNAFVLEEWEVMTIKEPKVMKEGKEINRAEMDFTYEYLESLEYEDGKEIQTRRAVSKLLDGRNVIFDNPEIEDEQNQPAIWIEEIISRDEFNAVYGTLTRAEKVPTDLDTINNICPAKVTLFNTERLKDPKTEVMIHRKLSKSGIGKNSFNIYANGVMLLPRKTPFTLFYPRNNYPISNITAERLTGSIYCRSVPAKTKFNADFIDWALKMLADKFEQGIYPAILTQGRYTLTRDIFRGGQVTHGVKKGDFEKADPENSGATNQDFSFVKLLKEIVESQTVNPTTAGELSSNATATEIATVDQNQTTKLGFLLDGLVNGFTDLYMRRAETIESKYTVKQREAVVDGKNVPVYQNFTVSMSGVNHNVTFDESIGNMDASKIEASDYDLFQKSHKDKKMGKPSEYYLCDPRLLRERKFSIYIEVQPEKVKDTQLQMMTMWEEFNQLLGTFGASVNQEELKKIYLETSNRSDALFQNADMQQQLQQLEPQGGGAANKGSFGKPRISDATREAALGMKTR